MGIKEATGDMKQVSEIIRLCGDKITVLSGDDFTNLTLLALGGKGAISVTANICPGDMQNFLMPGKEAIIAKARQLSL